MNKKTDVKYYNVEQDPMWRKEVQSLLPWFFGRGVDIGAGARSISKDVVRVDIDKNVKPDIVASGDALPFKDEEFDYVCSIHSFEHFEDQEKVLKEWLRVLKVGGIIGIVHPDIDYTKKQNLSVDKKGLKENPYNRHYHENTLHSFRKQLEKWKQIPFDIIDFGVACPNWSFYYILKKKKAGE